MKYAKSTSMYEVYTLGQRQRTRVVFDTLKQVQLYLLGHYRVYKTYSQFYYLMRKANNNLSLELWDGHELKIVCIKEL